MDNQPHETGDHERLSRLTATPPAPAADSDAIVREYEERYAIPREGKRKSREMPRSYSTQRVSEEERVWAAVAHASVWITMLIAVMSFGFLVPLSIFIPLGVYLFFRKRSDYVAFHALQAFVLQLVGTVGAFLLLTVGGLVWLIGMVVAILAVAVLVGFVLAPLWALVGVALMLVVVGLPIATLIYGTIAAIETYNGRDYRYPFVARWVDRQLAGGFLNTI